MPRLGAPMSLRGGEGRLKAGPGSPMVGGGMKGHMNVLPVIPSMFDGGLRPRGDMVLEMRVVLMMPRVGKGKLRDVVLSNVNDSEPRG